MHVFCILGGVVGTSRGGWLFYSVSGLDYSIWFDPIHLSDYFVQKSLVTLYVLCLCADFSGLSPGRKEGQQNRDNRSIANVVYQTSSNLWNIL